MSPLDAFAITGRWPAANSGAILICSFPTPNGVKVSIALEEMGLPCEAHKVTSADADVKSPDQVRTHLADFLAGYSFARRLKTLNGLTPCEYIRKIWTSEPDRFIPDPIHQMPGLNT